MRVGRVRWFCFSITTSLLFVYHTVNAVESKEDQSAHKTPQYAPALGIYETFSLWNTPIKLGYNPEGAPEIFSDTDNFMELLREAAQRWSLISNVEFELLAPGEFGNDRYQPSSVRDGIVSINWEATDESFSGQAGLSRQGFMATLGYAPYQDGAVTLNNTVNWTNSSDKILRTLTHELGHIIGLGHSDNPVSMMFANPYNQMQYPMEDDIRAAQTLYGTPPEYSNPAVPVTAWEYQPLEPVTSHKATFLNEQETLSEWVYEPPGLAPADRTRYLFKANGHPTVYGSGPMLVLSDNWESKVTGLDGDEPDDSYLVLYTPIGSGDTSSTIDIDAKIVVVNPLGFVNYQRDWQITCPILASCIKSKALNWNRTVKDIPGEWKIYVVEDLPSPESDQLLFEMSFNVEGEQQTSPMFANAFISANGEELFDGAVTDDSTDEGWLRVETPINNNWSPFDIASNIEFVLVDPNGYSYNRWSREMECAAVRTCERWTGLIEMHKLKLMPGDWRVYINDADTNEMFHSIDFKVNTLPTHNHAPTAKLIVDESGEPGLIRVKVIASDKENDNLTISWAPGMDPVSLGSDNTSGWRTLSIGANKRTHFIEVRDNTDRYTGTEPGTGAGDGFQTLIRLELSQNAAGNNIISAFSSSTQSYRNEQSSILIRLPEYIASTEWPSPYNGVTTPQGKNIPVNNIALLDLSSTTLHTCVSILNNGQESQLDGIEKFDINFELLNLDTGSIQVKGSRAFNMLGAVNENFQFPDCSGTFDLSTNVYTDYIQIGDRVFSARFTLENANNLTFILTDAEVIH